MMYNAVSTVVIKIRKSAACIVGKKKKNLVV